MHSDAVGIASGTRVGTVVGAIDGARVGLDVGDDRTSWRRHQTTNPRSATLIRLFSEGLAREEGHCGRHWQVPVDDRATEVITPSLFLVRLYPTISSQKKKAQHSKNKG